MIRTEVPYLSLMHARGTTGVSMHKSTDTIDYILFSMWFAGSGKTFQVMEELKFSCAGLVVGHTKTNTRLKF